MKLKVNYKRKIVPGLARLILAILVTAVSQGDVLAASGSQRINEQGMVLNLSLQQAIVLCQT